MRNNFLAPISHSWFSLAVLVIVLIGTVCIGWSVLFSHDYTITQKLLRFNYTLKNTSSELVRDARFDVALPMDIKDLQRVVSITAADAYQLNTSDTGEQQVSFMIDQIAPFGTRLITFTAVVELTDKPKKANIQEEHYLGEEKYIEASSSVVKNLAARLDGGSHEKTAKNIYDWLINNVTPLSYVADSQGAQYLLEKKTGDCTEMMYAFIALARANGIPARGVKGFWIPQESSVINAADYHDWAEFYDGDKWVLVDANKQTFSTVEQNYLVIGLYGDTDVNRFSISSNNIAVSFSQ